MRRQIKYNIQFIPIVQTRSTRSSVDGADSADMSTASFPAAQEAATMSASESAGGEDINKFMG